MRTETVRCDMCGAEVRPGDMHGSYRLMTDRSGTTTCAPCAAASSRASSRGMPTKSSPW